jgi:hypothetical protein
MHQVPCPNCGSTITFRAGETVYAVCDYCSTAMVRNDVAVESIGKVAILQDAWSPLQIGTEGDFDGGHFFVIGQVVYKWDAGTWSEWYLSYNDGRCGWMTEAQGHYALSFAAKQPPEVNDPDSLKVGVEVVVDSRKFRVTDVKSVELSFAKGELPFKAIPGRKSLGIDLGGLASDQHAVKSGSGPVDFASIELSDDGVLAFIGRYEEFDALRFVNLRQIHGW